MFEEGMAVDLRFVLAERQAVGGTLREQGAQLFLALDQRQASHIRTFAHQDIEHAEHDGLAILVGDRDLQRREIAGAVRARHDHFAVNDEMLVAELQCFLRNRRVATGPVVAAARKHPHLIAVAMQLRTITVFLEFDQPPAAFRRRADLGCEARFDIGEGCERTARCRRRRGPKRHRLLQNATRTTR